MKKTLSYSLIASTLLMAGFATSCATEDPFGSDGEGTLSMKMVINSDVTRAANDEDALRANCVLYISSAKGLIHKWQGLENVPETLTLKNGQYTAEAWAGDSVPASFDKKYFTAYQPFEITSGMNQVVVNCKIANSVVSINSATVNPDLMKDWKITVGHSQGELEFNADNMDYAKGYFMMNSRDKNLTCKIEGTNAEGRAFSKEYVIENAQKAHEYVLNLAYNPEYESTGGAFVTITVDDSEVLVESEVGLFSRPSIKGVGFDADKQLVGNAGAWKEQIIKISAFGGIKEAHLLSADYAAFRLPSNDVDLFGMVASVKDELQAIGLTFDQPTPKPSNENLFLSYVHFGADFLNALPERDTEYALTVAVTDTYGKTTEQQIRFAVGEGAVVIEDPVLIESATDQTSANYSLMNIGATSAKLFGSIVDAAAENPGIRVREAGSLGEWTFAPAGQEAQLKMRSRNLTPAQARRAKGEGFSVQLRNLKPGTRYEYQAVAGEFVSETMYFTTESTFTIPNASLEDWSTYSAQTLLGKKNVKFAGTGNTPTFWDSGNEGSATANMTLTLEDATYKHSGNYGAKLGSASALGVMAAGNLFAGDYVETDGTNGVLKLGREYNGSHPSKLRVWVNYRPGEVDIVKTLPDGALISKGGKDCGQIYVALTTAPIDIRTNPKKQKLFNRNDTEVVAYGDKIWQGTNHGADGALEAIEIPIEYKASAKSDKPLYLVIVCTASLYGDYFSGSSKSVMYVDDFELVYE